MKNEISFHVPVRPMPPEWLFEINTPNFDPTTTNPTWTGTELTKTIKDLQATTPYYTRVAARDVWKNTDWNYSNQMTQSTSDA